MKPETRERIREYLAVLPPGGLVTKTINEFADLNIPTRRKIISAFAMLDFLRLTFLTSPLWLPYTSDSPTNEKQALGIYILGAITYLGASEMSITALNYLTDSWKKYYQKKEETKNKVDRLYPPKIHPANQPHDTGSGDLEKRL